MIFLPPATKLGQGNIFRSVCQELCPRGVYITGGVRGGGMHAWGACMAGGVHGQGVCMAGGACMAVGGLAWGHVWQQGVCMAGGHVWWQGGHAWQILRDMVYERAVHILLECILVRESIFS